MRYVVEIEMCGKRGHVLSEHSSLTGAIDWIVFDLDEASIACISLRRGRLWIWDRRTGRRVSAARIKAAVR